MTATITDLRTGRVIARVLTRGDRVQCPDGPRGRIADMYETSAGAPRALVDIGGFLRAYAVAELEECGR